MKKRPYFQNEQWKVTRTGIDCRTFYYTNGAPYHLLIDALGKRHHSILQHMAEKLWVDLPLFIEAFREALKVHRVHPAWDAASLERACAEALEDNADMHRREVISNRIIRERHGTGLVCINAGELLEIDALVDAELGITR